MANRIQKANNRGQAFVEFAFSILVLVFFVFGIFEVGRLFHMKISLANSAREGARYLIRHTSDVDPDDPEQEPYEKTINAILNEAKNFGITISSENIEVSCEEHQGKCRSGRDVIVTISIDVEVGIVSNMFGAISLEETAIMRTP